MNPSSLLSVLGAFLERLACQWREARRARQAFDELAQMDAHALSDIGISHASIALSARREACCS